MVVRVGWCLKEGIVQKVSLCLDLRAKCLLVKELQIAGDVRIL